MAILPNLRIDPLPLSGRTQTWTRNCASNPHITGGIYFNVFDNYVINPALTETKDSDTLNDHVFMEQGHSLRPTAERSVVIPDASRKPEGCTGFPTGIFRIRAAGTDHYWTPHCFEARLEGISFCIWSLNGDRLEQVFRKEIYAVVSAQNWM